MPTLLDLTIEGDPIVKGRPRVGRGRAYTPKRTADMEAVIRNLARELVAEPYAGPVGMRLAFDCRTARRADGDNLQKLVWDALNGVVYLDDSQIEAWSGTLVRKSPTPQTHVVVYTLDPEEA